MSSHTRRPVNPDAIDPRSGWEANAPLPTTVTEAHPQTPAPGPISVQVVDRNERTDDELQEAFAARLQVALSAARQVVDNVMATEKVTRFEVIDHTTEGAGRLLVRYGVKVEASFQDDGRTMKVFLTDPPDPDAIVSDRGFTYKVTDL